MDERITFISAYNQGDLSMSELCRQFGISRETGYELVKRVKADGLAGLGPRSRAPLHHPNAIAPEVIQAIVNARVAHPTWGPKKLVGHHRPLPPGVTRWPALSTVGALLAARGLTVPRKRRPRAWPSTTPLAHS